ncbi:MobA/MobL family protein [Xanthomonas citri pv. citri]|uniref:Plasmid mobilization protein n=4 Tax=Xanthomonas citri TaxID=346 RepID=A0AAI7ZHC8_XANAC|nr:MULTISPECIES: MobQ family relaxase [Xanthomonas]AAM38104.1 plasmid mobilization protein [Xanthomonas citri pv. citri str. 306]AGH78744.1 plasmid mobilization protein [Xanthomonas axonopodis Xac29-1]AJD69856.1 plasmid mobilization system relaxase [Xanthomonas citri subsp. citri A306]AJY83368.1 plasmid mobilization system relaxase [Xanthomonas citri pv. citri]AJY87794.1 plasmid mobilization system relaxase [Xanthomonas citri subsp. citri UI6]
MAIYHSRVKVFSRSRGDSAVAAAAYRAGLLLIDHLTGQRHDYRRRGGVVASECLAPQDAPAWALVPAELWQKAEAAENRKNSVVAREFEVALPHELNDEQRSVLATAIGQALVARYGFAVQASIHSPGSRDGLNHHVHLLATTRRLTSDGFAEKTRELDGGASGKIEIEWIRQTIASTINEHLAAAGIDARVDHRRLEVQAEDALARGDWAEAMVLSRQPTKHVGKTATALARNGVMTDRAAENARIIRENEEAFERLLAQAEQEGRAIPNSIGHSHDQAQRDRRRRAGSRNELQTSVPGLEIHGFRGMRLSDALGRPAEDARVRPLRSITELVAEAARDLADILSTRPDLALTAAQRVVGQWTAHASTLLDSIDLRRWLNGLVERLGRLKRSVLKFAQRTSALGRAEKLFHLAEQAWEQFNGDHPRPDGEWTSQEWEKRRGRRLAVLEKRATELAAARAAASEKRWNDYENEIELRTAEVEQWSEEVLASPELDIASRPVELVKAASAAPKPYPMPTPAPRPTSRRPRP